jgi:hypothetical protein
MRGPSTNTWVLHWRPQRLGNGVREPCANDVGETNICPEQRQLLDCGFVPSTQYSFGARSGDSFLFVFINPFGSCWRLFVCHGKAAFGLLTIKSAPGNPHPKKGQIQQKGENYGNIKESWW